MITFIDFFAGIGIASLAFKDLGFICKEAIEIYDKSRQVYFKNIGFLPKKDIYNTAIPKLPKVDFYFASPPMRLFSKSNRTKSYKTKVESTYFFHLFDIIGYHQPKIVIIESISSLRDKEKDYYLYVIHKALVKLGYKINYYQLKSHYFDNPLSRTNLYIIATLKQYPDFKLNPPQNYKFVNIKNILDRYTFPLEFTIPFEEYSLILKEKYEKETIHYCGYMKKGKLKDIEDGIPISYAKIPQGCRIIKDSGLHPSFLASENAFRYYVYRSDWGLVQKLSIEQAYRIAGIPDHFTPLNLLPFSSYQLGQSSSYSLVSYIGKELIKYLQ